MMALYCLHAMASSVASVAVHLKGYMLGNGALLESADEEFPQLLDSPFSWRRFEDEATKNGCNLAHVVLRWWVGLAECEVVRL